MAVLLVLIILLSVFLFSRILLGNWRLSPKEWIRIAERTALPPTRKILETDPYNRSLVYLWLNTVGTPVSYHRLLSIGEVDIMMRMIRNVSTLLLDRDGTILGYTGDEYSAESLDGRLISADLLSEYNPPVQYALDGGKSPEELVREHPSGDGFIITLPVYSESGDVMLGVLAAHFGNLPSAVDVAVHTLKTIGKAAAGILILTGAVAVIFGFFSSRRLTDRLRRFSKVAERWSEGDYRDRIQDTADDEIGSLAERFNSMAGHTAELLKQKRQIAVVQERQRIARDLHDSVKQQALAASMQLGTALKIIQDEAAAEHIREADYLLDSLRSELTDLVDGLHFPGVIDDLSVYLRYYIDRWAERNSINTAVDIPANIPESIAGSIYRMLQEALSNIARHSAASMMNISVIISENTCVITVEDNGRGFDPDCNLAVVGRGLHGIRERAENLGGSLTISSVIGKGTILHVILPLEKG